MKIHEEEFPGGLLFRLSGELTIHGGDVKVRETLISALTRTEMGVLNLAGVTTIDSSGLGELVGVAMAWKRRRKRLVLSNLPPKVSDALTATQLITVFPVYETEETAVRDLTR